MKKTKTLSPSTYLKINTVLIHTRNIKQKKHTQRSKSVSKELRSTGTSISEDALLDNSLDGLKTDTKPLYRGDYILEMPSHLEESPRKKSNILTISNKSPNQLTCMQNRRSSSQSTKSRPKINLKRTKKNSKIIR